MCAWECLYYNLSLEKPWRTRKVRTVWVKFGKKLEEFNRLAARTQSATGSCKSCSAHFGKDDNSAAHLSRKDTQGRLRNCLVSLVICKRV